MLFNTFIQTLTKSKEFDQLNYRYDNIIQPRSWFQFPDDAAVVTSSEYENILLRTFISVETAALTFRTKQYSTSYSSRICYGKRFYNDFFLNHHTIALVNNCLKLLSCVVIETALDLMKKNQLS